MQKDSSRGWILIVVFDGSFFYTFMFLGFYIISIDLDLEICFKSFSNQNILFNLDLTLYESKCILLSGKNGSGKSTLLKIMAGLEEFGAEKYILLSEEEVSVVRSSKIEISVEIL